LLPNVYRIFQAIVRVFHRGWKHKQDQQGKAAFNERSPHMTKQQRQGAQADPKQKQDRAQSRARTD
jgi:hypothetical protein